MSRDTNEQIESIINDVDDLTIATIRDDGYPQATTVSYVNDGVTIYFGTTTNSQKAKNISRNDKISATINKPYSNWDEIEGLSMAGKAIAVTDPDELQKVERLMFTKFPQMSNYAEASEALGDLAIFRIEPEVVSILDYRQGFGHTEFVDLRR